MNASHKDICIFSLPLQLVHSGSYTIYLQNACMIRPQAVHPWSLRMRTESIPIAVQLQGQLERFLFSSGPRPSWTSPAAPAALTGARESPLARLNCKLYMGKRCCSRLKTRGMHLLELTCFIAYKRLKKKLGGGGIPRRWMEGKVRKCKQKAPAPDSPGSPTPPPHPSAMLPGSPPRKEGAKSRS